MLELGGNRKGRWIITALFFGLLAACERQAPLPARATAPSPAAVTTGAEAPRPATAASAAEPVADFPGPPVPRASREARTRPDAGAILPYFARPGSDGGWHFPTPYHYQEWRLAAGLRRERPKEWPDAGGHPVPLSIDPVTAPVVVILIDDLGNAGWALRRLAQLPYPVNGAILPHTPLVKRAAKAVAVTGGDVLLHLPLEPIGFPQDDPGAGALFVTMPTAARAARFAAAWRDVPGALGLNNHMGSRFTADGEAMGWLAGAVAGRGALFVDSRTVPRSQAQGRMLLHGVPALGRTHFLDETATDEAVSARLREAVAHARRHGAALAIGHPNRATVRVLEQAPDLFRAAGVRAVPLRALFLSPPRKTQSQ